MAEKRYLVVVHLPDRSTKPSHVVGNLGAALRTADIYPARPTVVLSGPLNMLRHAKRSFVIPPQDFLKTKEFLAHVYAVADLMGFDVEVIQNASNWDIRAAKGE